MRPVGEGQAPALPGFEPPAEEVRIEGIIDDPAAPSSSPPDDGRETMGGEAPTFLARGLGRRAGPLPLPPRRRRGFSITALRKSFRLGMRGAPMGPGPSKIAYRMRRAWAKPGTRSAVLVYLPLALLGVIGWRVVADDGLRRAAEAGIVASWEAVAARPEFALRGLVVTGATPHLQAEVQRAIGLEAGATSLGLDVAALRERVTGIGGVADATVQIDPAGVLRVHVDPRPAVALWRDGAGHLFSVATDGTMVSPVLRRAALPDLPVLVGAGARDAVEEALEIFAGAPEVQPRLRAFVRVGERRWDLVLDRDLRILLPAERPLIALARILAAKRDEILERDLAVVDLRLPGRPTLRLTPRAIEELRLTGVLQAQEGKDL
ncbi:MAG: cell division protein FtsQ/DivIB [Pseudomonadota bacterium]